MLLPRIYIPKPPCVQKQGFTLIETLVVLATLVLVAGLVLFFDLNNYRGSAFRAERSTIITVLESARANALNNIDQASHGVAIHPPDHPDSYVLFEGSSYAASDISTREVIDASYPVTITPIEVIFSQLSGNANYDGTIALVDAARNNFTFTISVNREGRIHW